MTEEIKLLDHGYLKFIESWGSDERIIEAARMSTNKGFLGWGPKENGKPGDEKLLKYLWDNKHSSPFEMAGMVIEVQAPIMVFREWHRHRTQCLAGDTIITCVTPTGVTFKRTIKEIYDLKYGGIVDGEPKIKNGYSKIGTPVMRPARHKIPWRTRVLPNCQNRILRVLNENTGLFQEAPMKDVWQSGEKQLYLLKIDDRSIRTSAEHPFLTKRGWVKLKDLQIGDEIARMGKVATSERPIPPSLRAGIGVWTTMMRSRLINSVDKCYVCETELEAKLLELDHVVPVFKNLELALTISNLKPICLSCHRKKINLEQPNRKGMTRRGIRWDRIDKLPTKDSIEMTYDIEVDDVNHNYVANDFVVHNSYNEMSARYTEIPELFYVPSDQRMANGAQAKHNKQSSQLWEDKEAQQQAIEIIKSTSKLAFDQYHTLLSMGVSRELARLILPVNSYSRMRASANLRNWLGFLTLRMDEAAQWEIRMFANAVGSFISESFPRTWDLFLGSAQNKNSEAGLNLELQK